MIENDPFFIVPVIFVIALTGAALHWRSIGPVLGDPGHPTEFFFLVHDAFYYAARTVFWVSVFLVYLGGHLVDDRLKNYQRRTDGAIAIIERRLVDFDCDEQSAQCVEVVTRLAFLLDYVQLVRPEALYSDRFFDVAPEDFDCSAENRLSIRINSCQALAGLTAEQVTSADNWRELIPDVPMVIKANPSDLDILVNEVANLSAARENESHLVDQRQILDAVQNVTWFALGPLLIVTFGFRNLRSFHKLWKLLKR